MNIGIIGTGTVGQTLAAKLAQHGNEVFIGTRDIAKTLARTSGNPSFGEWHAQNKSIKVVTFAEAASHGELVLNATNGSSSLEALKLAGEKNLAGKILFEISNPLDFSKGMPPSLFVCNTDSLGEQIQRAFPSVKVVKTLNTVSSKVMINPGAIAGGEHHLFVCGNDADAKAKVVQLLKDWFGWKHIMDLGDITNARGMEMLLPFWIRVMGVLETPVFNFKIAQ
jgi:predicted dinucleotide-binding enzyme